MAIEEQLRQPAIELHGLRKRFGAAAALRGATATIPAGSVAVIAGPDGAGKTTLLRICLGLLSPDEGAVRVLGFELPHQAEEVKRVAGYLPQRLGIHMHMTVRENIEYFAALAGLTGSSLRQAMDELLEATQLGPFANRLAANLSGGMRQKLAFICAVINRPRLAILDEPSTGLDPISRRDMWELIYRLHGQGTSVVVATPNWEEAARAQYVLVMHRGRFAASGPPQSLISQARARVFTAQAGPDALAALASLPWVASARVHGRALRIVVGDAAPHDAAQQLGAALSASVSPAEPSMEDAAALLISRMEASDA